MTVPVINARLAAEHPDAHCELNYDTPFQLAVATILSAQCTDVRVNKVTPGLFAAYPDAAAMAGADIHHVEDLIRSTGFFRNKAKNIVAMANTVMEEYGGEMPRTLDELVALPGVGRKTANVILGNAFGVPGLTVDTHFLRLMRRLGITTSTNAVTVEKQVMPLLDPAEWTMFSHRLIFHGRRVCTARSPHCEECVLADICPKVGV
ncbi:MULTISPECIES: endonuclease III [Corynebacterium]|uniref:Endonuclease III n=2 Tax=Corynebacterium glucuronolyticum TaxID=39791 RepID=A0AAX1L9P9_9CORY|nr:MULTISPECIES: endonuclease III [Corynebacterium]EEI63637.1 endonuclease III [Corynebacterium glucuronolyticum ATCC 51866]MCT1443215.1 endonuclease III [Corynebacterium glucuronolyticum]MCT1563358.1 endonuclease III [Corynebacterium glucuronolyticum]OFO47595.1 endonuclease III [Corynebacterium sp. HMSC073D01]QRP70940.1 endonuclease III [Corynebacterium glucuronolyticum]